MTEPSFECCDKKVTAEPCEDTERLDYPCQRLVLNECCLAEIPRDLSEVENLRVLDMAGNEISNIDHLDELDELVVLNMSNNEITKVNNLKTLESLERLNLKGNKIVDISEIDDQLKGKNIDIVDLEDNYITIVPRMPNYPWRMVFLDNGEISQTDLILSRNPIILWEDSSLKDESNVSYSKGEDVVNMKMADILGTNPDMFHELMKYSIRPIPNQERLNECLKGVSNAKNITSREGDHDDIMYELRKCDSFL